MLRAVHGIVPASLRMLLTLVAFAFTLFALQNYASECEEGEENCEEISEEEKEDRMEEVIAIGKNVPCPKFATCYEIDGVRYADYSDTLDALSTNPTNSSNANPQEQGYINYDQSNSPFSCPAGSSQRSVNLGDHIIQDVQTMCVQDNPDSLPDCNEAVELGYEVTLAAATTAGGYAILSSLTIGGLPFAVPAAWFSGIGFIVGGPVAAYCSLAEGS